MTGRPPLPCHRQSDILRDEFHSCGDNSRVGIVIVDAPLNVAEPASFPSLQFALTAKQTGSDLHCLYVQEVRRKLARPYICEAIANATPYSALKSFRSMDIIFSIASGRSYISRKLELLVPANACNVLPCPRNVWFFYV